MAETCTRVCFCVACHLIECIRDELAKTEHDARTPTEAIDQRVIYRVLAELHRVTTNA